MLIIWDKLFGTFQKEGEAPVYGLTKPLNTYSFLWQHFHFAIELWLVIRRTNGLRNKLRVVFGKPEQLDGSLREQAEQMFGIKQNVQPIERPLNKYVIIQMLALLVCLFGFIGFEHYFTASFKFMFALAVLLTLINCGAIMEQKKWIFEVEGLRMLIMGSVLYYYLPFFTIKFLLIALLAVFVIRYKAIQNIYFYYVYRK